MRMIKGAKDADLLPAVNGEGSNELTPRQRAVRFTGSPSTPVASFSSARRPGLRPITPTGKAGSGLSFQPPPVLDCPMEIF
jgi:hypothetical protein